jgi:hypothetical protein
MCEGIMKQCYSFFLCLLTVSFLQASKGQTVDNARLHLEVVSANHFSILDTLFSFPAPGTFPTGLAWDGQYFWHADYNQNRVYKLTPSILLLCWESREEAFSANVRVEKTRYTWEAMVSAIEEMVSPIRDGDSKYGAGS